MYVEDRVGDGVKKLEELVRNDPKHRDLVGKRLELRYIVDIAKDLFKGKISPFEKSPETQIQAYYKMLGYTKVEVVQYDLEDMSDTEYAVYVLYFEHI